MKIIFAGTPEFSAFILKRLLSTEHQILAVYTQPDRPAGRGRKLTPSPVKEVALQHNLSLFQPRTLKDEQEQKNLKDLNADVMIVVAYGLILPKQVLTAPRYGCINIHASLLPRWRGAAPIQRAILAGDEVTGITMMQMDEGLDTGDILYKVACPILPEDTSETLHDVLMELSAETLIYLLDRLTQFKPETQDHSKAIYAVKLTKEEAKIDWHEPAKELALKVRGFNPWPVAHTAAGIRIWEAETLDNQSNQAPGTIVAATPDGIDVATSEGLLRILKLQMPGGKVLSAREILNARPQEFAVGKLFS